MKRIKNINEWMTGKTIAKVDDIAINRNIIHFTDGTGVWLEAENTGWGIYTPVYYELDMSRPVDEQ